MPFRNPLLINWLSDVHRANYYESKFVIQIVFKINRF